MSERHDVGIYDPAVALGPTLAKFQSLNDTLLATIAEKDAQLARQREEISTLRQRLKDLGGNNLDGEGLSEGSHKISSMPSALPKPPSKASAITTSLLSALESKLKRHEPQPQPQAGSNAPKASPTKFSPPISRNSSNASLNKVRRS